MKLLAFAVENLLSGLSDGVFTYKTSTLASVELAESLFKQKRNLNEYRLCQIGEFDNESCSIISSVRKVIPWDTRHCPMDVVPNGEVISPEKNQEIIDNISDKS